MGTPFTPDQDEGGTVGSSDTELVAAVRGGDTESFGELVRRYQARVFAIARRHVRRESEVEDVVQEVFLKAYSRLDGWRGDAPFEHWLSRIAVRTCYDSLRAHQRNREHSVSELSEDEENWLERHAAAPESLETDAEGARALLARVLDQLSPAHRLVINLLEIEERSVKEISALTGWSVPLVKVRAFRARAEMKKVLARLTRGKYL